MPFEVEPDSIVIGMANAGPDDFLRCTMEEDRDGPVFLRRRQEPDSTELVLDRELLPRDMYTDLLRGARAWLRGPLDRLQAENLEKLFFAGRQDPSQRLDRFVAELMFTTLRLRFLGGGDDRTKLNLGVSIRTSYRSTQGLEFQDIPGWYPKTPVKEIVRVTRFQAHLASVPRNS